MRVREQVKRQRKAVSSAWASGVRWEEGESCRWGQGVSGLGRGVRAPVELACGFGPRVWAGGRVSGMAGREQARAVQAGEAIWAASTGWVGGVAIAVQAKSRPS